jgi:uncharacterized protein (DUF58 family)
MRMSGFLWLYLAGALLIPGRPLYTVLYFAGGVFLLARFSLSHAARRLAVRRELSDQRIFLGESVTVTLHFKNPTGMPVPWVQFIESRPQQMASEPFCQVLTLGPGEEAISSYTLHGNKRGRYDVGPITLTAGDPFGFGRFEARMYETARFTVYPRVSPLPDLGLPARLPMGDLATRRRLFEDPAWLTGTRPYVSGDSMKRIHWNATARTGELMVKQFRHAMLLPSCVLMNLNRFEYASREFWTSSELAIDAAATLCHHLVEQKQQVGLVATGIDPDAEGADAPGVVTLPLRQGRGAMVEVLELLARIEAVPEGRVPFARTLVEQAQRLPYGTLLCVITPRETDEIAAACARIARSGQQVLLFLTDGGMQAAGTRPGYRVLHLVDRRGEVALG